MKMVVLCCALLSLIGGVSAARSRFHLQQDDDGDQYATNTEMKFDYTNAFLAGFRSQETLPSATNCTRYLERSILLYNETYMEW